MKNVFDFIEEKKGLIGAVATILAVIIIFVAFYCCIIDNNVNIPKESYTVGDFYTKSMVSYFGWFELQTPWFMAVPFVVFIYCMSAIISR